MWLLYTCQRGAARVLPSETALHAPPCWSLKLGEPHSSRWVTGAGHRNAAPCIIPCFLSLLYFFLFCFVFPNKFTYFLNLTTLGKKNNLRVPPRPAFQRVKPRTEKLEAELKRRTSSQCLVRTFLTLLAPLTAIISGVAGTASLSYAVLRADPSTQQWSKTIWSLTSDRITIQSQRTSRHWSPSLIFLTSLSANVALLEVLGVAKLSWSQTHSLCLPTSGSLCWKGTWSWCQEKGHCFLGHGCVSLLATEHCAIPLI